MRMPSPTRIFRDEVGATSIEYALIGTLISIVIVTALTSIGVELDTMFTSVVEGFK